MSPLNKQKLDQIRDTRRDQIKKAALKVFARYGYASTKTSLIASEAGISEGLLYRYFNSKKELFIRLVQELLAEAEKELGGIHQLQGTPFEQIKTLTAHMIDENNKYSFMLIQQARKAKDIPEEVQQLLEKFSPQVLIDLLLPLFIKGQATEDFSPGEPRRLLTWYFSIIDNLIMQENEAQEYGLPSADILMRILTK